MRPTCSSLLDLEFFKPLGLMNFDILDLPSEDLVIVNLACNDEEKSHGL